MTRATIIRTALTAAVSLAVLALATPVTEAKTVGKIGGKGAFTRNCTWVCHPKIPKARAQYCSNKKGKSKLVYWESMPVTCDPTLGD